MVGGGRERVVGLGGAGGRGREQVVGGGRERVVG